MSEPGSGSDLASVCTRAERTARGWLLNGQRIWTTHAMHSDYMIALVRTPEAPIVLASPCGWARGGRSSGARV